MWRYYLHLVDKLLNQSIRRIYIGYLICLSLWTTIYSLIKSMKKSLFLIFLGTIVLGTLSWCSVDRNDEKAQRIIELETKVKDQSFEKNLKCNALFDGLKRKYYNVYSVYYDEYMDTCYVKYKDTKTKELNDASLEDFWPN